MKAEYRRISFFFGARKKSYFLVNLAQSFGLSVCPSVLEKLSLTIFYSYNKYIVPHVPQSCSSTPQIPIIINKNQYFLIFDADSENNIQQMFAGLLANKYRLKSQAIYTIFDSLHGSRLIFREFLMLIPKKYQLVILINIQAFKTLGHFNFLLYGTNGHPHTQFFQFFHLVQFYKNANYKKRFQKLF